MGKPFLSIEDQVALLERRGVVCNGNTGNVLMREGYYRIVNGYKEPFIDGVASADAGDDRYKPGTTFDDLYALFLFDRALRERTFHCTLKAEALVRTACSHLFAIFHEGAEDYLVQDSFSSEAEYRASGLKRYRDDMQTLQHLLYDKSRNSKRAPIAHYREKHGEVPIWILACDLTFGNVEHFFNLMKPAEQTGVCKTIAKATGHLGGALGYYSPAQARADINTVVKVRNMCAHDERLYCARIGARKNTNYLGFLRCVRHLVTDEDFDELISSVVGDMKVYSDRSETVAHVIEKMGITTATGGAKAKK